MLFTDETDRRQNLLCEDGVVLLEYTIEFPRVAIDCPLRKCLAEIAERTEEYLVKTLAEALRTSYLSSNARHKRYTFRRASYRLICFSHGESLLVRDVSLVRGARILHSERVLWGCSERGLFMPSEGVGL